MSQLSDLNVGDKFHFTIRETIASVTNIEGDLLTFWVEHGLWEGK